MATLPPQQPEMPDLLTPTEVARRLSIGMRTLWRMVASGELPQPVHLNRRLVRFRAVDIQRYLEGLPRKRATERKPLA